MVSRKPASCMARSSREAVLFGTPRSSAAVVTVRWGRSAERKRRTSAALESVVIGQKLQYLELLFLILQLLALLSANASQVGRAQIPGSADRFLTHDVSS